jgi:large subunit ribosomal protein L9
MEVILLERIEKLGNLGDRVTVAPGYGRNFLIPRGKAAKATEENIAHFETRRAELEKRAADSLATSQARLEELADLVVTLAAKVGNEGRLFGSVGAGDIAEAVTAAGIRLEKREVRLSQGSIRQVGEYDVDIHLHSDVETKIRVNVMAE